MTARIDFTGPDYFRNPAASLEKVRAQGPVVEVSFPIVGRIFATTTRLFRAAAWRRAPNPCSQYQAVSSADALRITFATVE